jgi:hypothetical protein
MVSNKIKRALVCRECGREGEFVYEKASTSSKGPRINHESLTPGFRFKDTGVRRADSIPKLGVLPEDFEGGRAHEATRLYRSIRWGCGSDTDRYTLYGEIE